LLRGGFGAIFSVAKNGPKADLPSTRRRDSPERNKNLPNISEKKKD